nr:hypothetical protein [Candidatus Sigynarchaeota archaeon]
MNLGQCASICPMFPANCVNVFHVALGLVGAASVPSQNTQAEVQFLRADFSYTLGFLRGIMKVMISKRMMNRS